MTSSTSSTSAFGSAKARIPGTSSRNRSRRAGSREATAPDRPARPRQRDAERRPHRARADDPDDRPLARPRVRVRVARGRSRARGRRGGGSSPGSPVPARPPALAHRLPAGARPRGRIEVDAVLLQVLERLLVLLRATLGLAPEHLLGLVPGPHPAPPSARAGALYASTQRV